MKDMAGAPRLSALRTVAAYAACEAIALWRGRVALLFLFVVPALLSSILGPLAAGERGAGEHGRVTLGFALTFNFMIVTYAGHALYREFWHGTWIRQAAMRTPPAAYLAGKLLPSAVLGLSQAALFLALAVWHGAPLAGGVAQLALLALGLVGCGVALGFALHVYAANWQVMGNVAFLVLVASGSLGGAIVTWSRLPPWSRMLGYLAPHYWALRGVNEALWGAGAWEVVLRSAAVLAVMALACVLAGALAFDLRRRKF